MNSNSQFSCYILSENNRAIDCSKAILEKKQNLLGIISANSLVKAWAIEHNISIFKDIKDFLEKTKHITFDYFFSMINTNLFSDEMLTRPTKYAINFHDSLLPDYAGVNATAWAILNEEKYHGVTWHIMEKHIDAGPLVKQNKFQMHENETALSLNLRCYEAGLELFKELIDDIINNKLDIQPQNLSKRKFYKFSDIPENVGFINFNFSIKKILSVFNAMNYGEYDNLFCSPKFLLNDRVYSFKELKVYKGIENTCEGTIIKCSETSITVRASDGIVELSEIYSYKRNCFINDLQDDVNFKVGNKVKFPEDSQLKIMYDGYSKHKKYDNKNVQSFFKSQINVENLFRDPKKISYSDYDVIKINIKSGKITDLLKIAEPYDIKEINHLLCILIFIYFYKLNNYSSIGFMINNPQQLTNSQSVLLENFLDYSIPLVIDFNPESTFIGVLKICQSKEIEFQNNTPFLRDIAFRYRSLNNVNFFNFIKIDTVTNIEQKERESSNIINVTLNQEDSGSTINIFNFKNLFLNDYNNMQGHIDNIINNIIDAQGNLKLKDIDLVISEEKQQLMQYSMGTFYPIPQKCIHDLIAENAIFFPEHIALEAENKKINYSELNAMSNQLSYSLAFHQVKDRSFVAICVKKSPEFFIAVLAILKTGAAYIPLDPKYPSEWLYSILKSCKPALIIYNEENENIFNKVSGNKISLEKLCNSLIDKPSHDLEKKISLNSIAYVIYTSGSTGTPKGVEVKHIGLTNLCFAQRAYFKIERNSKVLQFSSISFDASVSEWAVTLAAGATLCIMPESDLAIDLRLKNAFEAFDITVATLPPSIVSMLPEKLLNILKTLVVAGERSPDTIVEKYADKLNLCNAYGPTETTVCATINHCQMHDSGNNIGHPIQNTCLYLVDKHQKLLPAGVPGEIAIAGLNLAKGYLYDDELTESRFPLVNVNRVDERVYLSGDVGRFMQDGSIEYMGRIDKQLKLRGYRIEPGQIEKEILKCNLVSHAIVLLRKNKTEHKQLIAFVVKKKAVDISERELIEEINTDLKKSLPAFMLPTIICIDSVPLTINGKVDENALLNKSFDMQNLDKKNEKGLTNIERILSAIWCKVLKLDSVDLKADFFELGGESLLAIQIIAEAKCQGIDISITDIFDHPTIMQLSNVCSFNAQEKNDNETNVVDFMSRNDFTPIQHWFFSQNLENLSNYSQSMLLSLKSNLTREDISEMIEALLSSNPYLSSRFKRQGQSHQQSLFLMNSNKAYEIDTVQLPEQVNQEIYIDELLKRLQRGLDIEKGPLIRGAIVFKNNVSQLFLFVIHHLLVDGVSWKIILDNINMMYHLRNLGKPAILNKIDANNYVKWAVYLQDNYRAKALLQLDYWKSVLACSKGYLDCVKLKKYLIKDTLTESSNLNEEYTRKLIKEVPKAFKTQINDILLTALVLAFGKQTGHFCLKIMLEGHGREDLDSNIDLTRTIGWFTTIYPILLEVNDAFDFTKCIKQIKEILRAIPDKGIGYGVLRYLSDKDQQTIFHLYELPDVAFNYLGQWDAANDSELFSKAELLMSNSSCDENHRAHLIEINCYMHDNKLKFYWSYDKNIFSENNFNKIIREYHLYLNKLIEHCTNNINFGYTPSDFMVNNLSQAQIDKVFSHIPNIKNIYPLSPMQNGHIFHIISHPESDAYHVQNLFELTGKIDEQVFKNAWDLLVKKYSVFRTGFAWFGLAEPLQFELHDVHLPWESHDISNLSNEQQNELIYQTMNDDRRKRFNYHEPPFLRLYWFYVSNHKCYLLLSFHHLLLDGWCKSIIFHDLSNFYDKLINGEKIFNDAAVSYSTYIKWLLKKDESRALAYWKEYLQDIKQNELPIISDMKIPMYEYYYEKIDQIFLDHIKQYCKNHGLTLNSIFLTTWAILLCQYLNQSSIVLGVIFSGRTIDLKDVDKMVGLFINVLPLKFEILKKNSIIEHIKLVQANINKMQEHSYVSISKIGKMTSCSPNAALFDVLYTFQNYPDPNSALQASQYLKINIIEEIEKNEYPLSLNVILGSESDVQLKFSYCNNYFNTDIILQLSKNFVNTLMKITEFSYQEVA